jgi:hypothetical protein
MNPTRSELQQQLDLLDTSIPILLETQESYFIEAFAGMAEAIVDNAAPSDRLWVEDQAMAILERRGLVAPAPTEA